MLKLTESERSMLQNYPIEGILSALGKNTAHGRDNCYFSPFRQESVPSFHISPDGARWYDFGLGAGGRAVALVCRLLGCDGGRAYDFLAGLSATYVPVESSCRRHSSGRSSAGIRIFSVSDAVGSASLRGYAISRGISTGTLESCCSEVCFGYTGRQGYRGKAIGLKNNSGGWVLRSGTVKKCTSNDITTIDSYGTFSDVPTSPVGVMFEGMFDCLSFLEILGAAGCDICVLNSVTNVVKAERWIKAHDALVTFMDNDDAGRKATLRISGVASEGKRCKRINDWSDLYSGFNDLNGRLALNEDERKELTIILQSLWNRQFQRTFRKD